VVLPGRSSTIPVGRARSRALAESLRPGDWVILGVQRDPALEDPSLADLFPIATLGRVQERSDRGARGIVLVVDARERVALKSLIQAAPYWTVRAEPVTETGQGTEAQLVAESLKTHMRNMSPTDRGILDVLDVTSDPGLLADRVAAWLEVEDGRKAEVLIELDIEKRVRLTASLLTEAKARAQLRQKIDSEVRKEMTKAQKEAMLRQQLRAIQKELGEGEDQKDKLRKKIESIVFTDDVQEIVDRELRRLDGMNAQQPEAQVIRNYLEWVSELPWNERSPAVADLDAVENKLEDDHYGLADVKRRILEHMAVLKLEGSAKGTILCLVGPPGVGKTSLAQSVADATGRPLQRVSLGGVRDEAEIRGHRRTYIGSIPGRIISAMRKAKVKNPVMVLDEIDKMGRGWHGDPEAALLEVLDPEQNVRFTDHYMEMPFDLSEVLFIATANDLSTLSPPLRDRLEIIEVSGYTTDEKVAIAEKHLVVREVKKTGLPDGSVVFTPEILSLIVREYTREAGVRQLGREIQKVARSLALEVARKPGDGAVVEVTEEQIRKTLGKTKFISEMAEHDNDPGIAAGLAWTPVGGEVLYIETTKMPGKGHIEITGQLGDVMKESARAAMAYVRSHAEELGVDTERLEKLDIHIHVPAGAVPKDGPSAGITMFTALASLLSGRRVKSDLAMTGEATLRGRVLPIGGVKSKVMAAHRAGFRKVILPKLNERDWPEVPEQVRNEMELITVEDMSEVLGHALELETVSPPPTTPSSGSGTTSSAAA